MEDEVLDVISPHQLAMPSLRNAVSQLGTFPAAQVVTETPSLTPEYHFLTPPAPINTNPAPTTTTLNQTPSISTITNHNQTSPGQLHQSYLKLLLRPSQQQIIESPEVVHQGPKINQKTNKYLNNILL